MGAPTLTVTPSPASTAAPASSMTLETTFLLSALLGSTSRQIFLPLPTTTLFQDSPSAVQSVALPIVPQAPLSGGGAGEESLPPQLTQPAASAVTTSDADTSSADLITTSTDPLLGSASTRASTTATPLVSSDPQLPSVTEGSSSDDDDDPDRFLARPVARLFGALMPKGERELGGVVVRGRVVLERARSYKTLMFYISFYVSSWICTFDS